MSNPIGFMSYAHLDDEHEKGQITKLCTRLSGEIRIQIGEEFGIFQDRKDIAWGEQWRRRIDESMDASTFLFPIITPGFLKSAECRNELSRFLDREKQLGRDDLIFPIYYVSCPILEDEQERGSDALAKAIAARQYSDWRELRFKSFDKAKVKKELERMAKRIADAPKRKYSPLPATSEQVRALVSYVQHSPQFSVVSRKHQVQVPQ
jgi:F-box protein 11